MSVILEEHLEATNILSFIDDCSKYCHFYLIKTKDEVINKFKICNKEVEN